MNSVQPPDNLIDQWLDEDIGGGDHTTLGTIPGAAGGRAELLIKEAGVLAGVALAKRIFHRLDSRMELEPLIGDGSAVAPGDVAFRVSGRVHAILQCERLVLNIMQRMSGIATTTRLYADKLEGTGARVLDTRKTSPGLRALEKEAVRLGGGTNHRSGLYDMVLVKDNHIDFAGGIETAIRRVRDYLADRGLRIPVEVEARSLDDVRRVLAGGGVDRILLDNFTPEETRMAVELIGGKFETEASGGITLENIREYAECGVDYISVGALTHRIHSLDMSLKATFGE